MSEQRERITIVSAPAETWLAAGCLKWILILIVVALAFKIVLVVGAAILITSLVITGVWLALYLVWWLTWLGYKLICVSKKANASTKLMPPFPTELSCYAGKLSFANEPKTPGDILPDLKIVYEIFMLPLMIGTIFIPAFLWKAFSFGKCKDISSDELMTSESRYKLCKGTYNAIRVVSVIPLIAGTFYETSVLWYKILPDLFVSKPKEE